MSTMTYDFSYKQTRYQLIPVLFTNILVFHGQCKHLVTLLSTTVMHLHFKDSLLKTLDS
jgi:hypothetical protein